MIYREWHRWREESLLPAAPLSGSCSSSFGTPGKSCSSHTHTLQELFLLINSWIMNFSSDRQVTWGGPFSFLFFSQEKINLTSLFFSFFLWYRADKVQRHVCVCHTSLATAKQHTLSLHPSRKSSHQVLPTTTSALLDGYRWTEPTIARFDLIYSWDSVCRSSTFPSNGVELYCDNRGVRLSAITLRWKVCKSKSGGRLEEFSGSLDESANRWWACVTERYARENEVLLLLFLNLACGGSSCCWFIPGRMEMYCRFSPVWGINLSQFAWEQGADLHCVYFQNFVNIIAQYYLTMLNCLFQAIT